MIHNTEYTDYKSTKIHKDNPLRVCTWFWNNPHAKHKGFFEFTAEHVNKLQRGFKRHLKMPHEFIVFTDIPDGLDTENVRIVPIWNDFKDWGRCYRRLKVFSSEMQSLLGETTPEYADRTRLVSVDLDVLLVNDVTSIFDRDEPFVGYRDSKNPDCYSGALHMQDAGSHEEVWNTFNMVRVFDASKAPPTQRVGSDQMWQSVILGKGKYPQWTWEDGIYDYWNIEELPGGELPANAKVIMFNGMRRDMSMDKLQRKHKWIKEHWV